METTTSFEQTLTDGSRIITEFNGTTTGSAQTFFMAPVVDPRLESDIWRLRLPELDEADRRLIAA